MAKSIVDLAKAPGIMEEKTETTVIYWGYIGFRLRGSFPLNVEAQFLFICFACVVVLGAAFLRVLSFEF